MPRPKDLPPNTSQKNPKVEDITPAEVLGMLIRKQRPGIPPALLCMSVEAREEIRQLGQSVIDQYRSYERDLKKAREAGNPRAFFVE